MTKLSPPPLNEPIIDSDGQISPSWALYFDEIYRGDRGTDWAPSFTGLTTVGVPTITGRYFRLSERICYGWCRIVPATSITATAGTTYIGNFPLRFQQDGSCQAVSGLLGSTPGMVDAASNRIYTPSFSAVTVPLTLTWINEVR